LKKITKKV